MVLKILMRQKMYLAKKRHNYLIMVQELILKVVEKIMRNVLTENKLNQRFSILFEACTCSERKNDFRTPCTIFVKETKLHQ